MFGYSFSCSFRTNHFFPFVIDLKSQSWWCSVSISWQWCRLISPPPMTDKFMGGILCSSQATVHLLHPASVARNLSHSLYKSQMFSRQSQKAVLEIQSRLCQHIYKLFVIICHMGPSHILMGTAHICWINKTNITMQDIYIKLQQPDFPFLQSMTDLVANTAS